MLALLLILTLVFSFPSVQTYVARKTTAWANEKYGLNASIKSFRYIFPDEVLLKQVYLPDAYGDTLIYTGVLDVKIGGYSQVSGTLGLRAVEMDTAKFYLHTAKGDSSSNLSQFIAKFSSGDTAASKPFNMEILDIELNESRFWLENFNCDSNCTAFKMVHINGAIHDFDLRGSTFSLDVQDLSLNDEYGLALKELWGGFTYGKHEIALQDFHLKTANSEIEGDYRMEFGSMQDMRDYVNKVRMVADLESSSVSSIDIQHFAPVFPDFKTFTIKGKVEGPVNDMRIKDLDLGIGEGSNISGDVHIRNTTRVESLYVATGNFNLLATPADARYFYHLFASDTLPEIVDELGKVGFSGTYKGYLRDFKTAGHISTSLGDLDFDLFFDQRSRREVHYKGSVETESIHLGELTGMEEAIGEIALSIEVDGQGFDPRTMATYIKGNVSRFEAMDYAYRNMYIDGQIEEGTFEGAFTVKDPNLQFVFDGEATFQSDTSRYDFVARIEEADLDALGLVEDSISEITAELDIDLRAYHYQDWLGQLRLSDVTYANESNFYFFEDVIVNSDITGEGKELEVRSNILDANVKGAFTYEGIFKAFQHEVHKYLIGQNKIEAPRDEQFDFNFTVKDTRLLTEIFVPELEIKSNTRLFGSYSDTVRKLELRLDSKGVAYGDYDVKHIDLQYSGGTSRSELGFQIGAFILPNGFEIDSINLGNFYYNDTLFYNLSAIFKDSVDGRARISGYALQEDTNRFEFGVLRSPFNIGYQDFEIQPNNTIYLDTGGVHIRNFRITNEDRLVAINGNISDNENQILRVNLRGFGMSLVNYFIATPEASFKGKLHGDVLLSQLLSKPRFAADLRIDSLQMNETALGNLSLSSDWSTENDTISLEAKMILGNLRTFGIKGYYQADSTGSIDLDVHFDRFRLAALNPFLTGVAENMRGFLDGQIKVQGPVSTPRIEGEVQLPKVAFTISFLQTDYNLEGAPTVQFKQDEILFPDLKLRDSKYGTSGTLSGKVLHDQFRDFELDLKIKADELLVLNTPPTTDDAYYGTAFATGEIRMEGPPSLLEVSANVTTERQTNFNIPLGGAVTESQKGYITFVDRDKPDTTQQETKRFNIDKGISLDFDINVNENAEVAIILDERTGNRLNAKGKGNIRLNIGRSGEMELFGTYTIKEGKYDFNLQGFFNREFRVEQGSSITFNGSPFDAMVDLTAVYTTRADPSLIVAGYTGGRTLTEVYLHINGNLTSPEITFDIKTPRAGPLVQAVVGNIGATDQKTEQVFSLLATNTFIPESGVSNTGSNLVNGWDILANQAASWFNEYSDRYDLSLNYQQDPSGQRGVGNSQEEFEVGLSTTFFNDRVTVNGTVGVPVGQNTNQVAGEVEIEYNITKDGRFRAKVFNRELDNQFIAGNQYQQGVGIYYRIDFDSFSELWQKLLGKEKKEEEAIEER